MEPGLFSVERSIIPLAGMGLFTNVDIKQGEILGEYYGTRFSLKEAKKLPKSEAVYLFITDSGAVILPDENCPFRYINDTIDLEISLLAKRPIYLDSEEYSYNVKWVTRDDNVYITTTRDIKNGEELFIPYSDEYWNVCITRKSYRSLYPIVQSESVYRYFEMVNKLYKEQKDEIDTVINSIKSRMEVACARSRNARREKEKEREK